MKSIRNSLAYLSMLFVLTGCYDVPYLIEDESKGVINDVALGTWVSVKQTPLARGLTLEVKRAKGSPWYDIRKVDLKTNEVRQLKAIAHQIDERLILSYQDDTDKDFSIFEIKLNLNSNPPLLEAIALGEGAPRFETKAQFVKFLKSKEVNYFFKEGYRFKKTG